MSWLLALVADAIAGGFGWAVAGDMAEFATVVALLTSGAITAEMAETSARVALLLTATATTTRASETSSSTTIATTLTSSGTVASNVSLSTTLVALNTGGLVAAATIAETTTAASSLVTLRALTRGMTLLAARIAGTRGTRLTAAVHASLGTIALDVTLATTAIACRVVTIGAVFGKMTLLVAIVASDRGATLGLGSIRHVELRVSGLCENGIERKLTFRGKWDGLAECECARGRDIQSGHWKE